MTSGPLSDSPDTAQEENKCLDRGGDFEREAQEEMLLIRPQQPGGLIIRADSELV